jgi:hypothetical protein
MTNAVNSIGKGSLAEALAATGAIVGPKAARSGTTGHTHSHGGNVI